MVHLPRPNNSWTIRILTLSFTLLYSLVVQAQPQPCGPEPDMTSTCIEACVICNIDGYTGINDDTPKGQAPPGFCTTTAHHMQWIAFIAGSKDLTITVTPSGCKLNAGLEVGIYESIDCNNFKLVSNCNGGIPPGTAGVFTNTQPLVIGQYYYFVMDGNANDVCSYTIRVTNGSTKVPPLVPAGDIQGPTEVCQGDSTSYSIPAISGATFYQWRIDGKLAGAGKTANLAFPEAGMHQLCVSAFNVCDTIEVACIPIQVHERKTTERMETLCENDCLELADTLICDPGKYVLRRQTSHGCDSIVYINVEPITTVSAALRAAICVSDSILVGDSWYRAPGSYVEVQPAASGCDSLIQLTLQGIICEIKGTASGVPVRCHGGRSGALLFSVLDGTPPFNYTWERLGGGYSGSGPLPTLFSEIRIDSLPAGSYIVTVRDTFGNDAVFPALISEPAPLRAILEPTDYNGFDLACQGGANGSLHVVPEGGTAPYNYTWNNGQNLANISSLEAGIYTVTISDALGCTLLKKDTLHAPPALTFEAIFTDPGCTGHYTGSISVQRTQGGVPPYTFSMSGVQFQSNPVFQGVGAGTYTIVAQDANGCLVDSTAALHPVEIPELDLRGIYQLQLGYTLQLTPYINVTPQSLQWTPSNGLSCTQCLQPTATPVQTTVYTLSVTSVDGCTVSDSLTVTVLKMRDTFVPNTFSPNGDGVNDIFTVFGGPAVLRVKQLKVFSRWGDLVFEQADFPSSDLAYGWDGRYKGQVLDESLFVWWSEVEYIDGVSSILKGEVTVVR